MFYFMLFEIIRCKWFLNTFKLSNNDINKLILFLRKDVCPQKYMDDWEKFNETLLSEKKKEFCSNLNMEDITDSDYKYGKRFCEDFKMKNLVEYDTAFS